MTYLSLKNLIQVTLTKTVQNFKYQILKIFCILLEIVNSIKLFTINKKKILLKV